MIINGLGADRQGICHHLFDVGSFRSKYTIQVVLCLFVCRVFLQKIVVETGKPASPIPLFLFAITG